MYGHKASSTSRMCSLLFMVVLFMQHVTRVRASSAECLLDPCLLPLTSCTFLNHPIYSSPITPLNISYNEEQANSVFSYYLFQYLSADCQEAAMLLLCSQLYSSCELNATTADITEIKPCIQMCTVASNLCITSVQQYAPQFLPYFNCTATKGDGSALYSSDSSQCVTLTSSQPLPCFASNSTTNNTDTNPKVGCQAYNKTATPNLSTMCPAFMAKEVFVPNIPSIQTIIDSQLAPQIAPIKLVYPMLAIGCYKALASLLCQAALPPCIHINDSFQAPLPHCNSYCLHVQEVCYESFQAIGSSADFSSLLNCSKLNPITGEPLFPSSGLCSNDLYPQDAYEAFVLPPFEKCPTVLGRKLHPSDKDAQCSYPCPDHTFSPGRMHSLNTVLLTFGSISFVLLVVLGVSQITIPEKRQFPASIQLWLMLALAWMNVSFFLNGTSPENDGTWCKDPATYATQQSSTKCAVQGFLYLFSALNALCWCVVIAFTLFYAVVLNGKLEKLKAREIYIHLFCLGIPSVFAFTAVGMKTMGFSSLLPFCFLLFTDYNTVNPRAPSGMTSDYPLYFIPMGIIMLVAIVLLLWTVVQIFVVQKAVASISNNSQTTQAMKRVLRFVVVLICIVIIFLEWRFEMQGRLQTIAAKSSEWYACKIKQDLAFPDPGHCPDDITPTGVQYGHMLFLCLTISCLGIIIFLIFGIDKENYHTWPIMFGMARQGKWHEIPILLKRGRDVMARTSSAKRLTKSVRTTGSSSEQTMRTQSTAITSPASPSPLLYSSSSSLSPPHSPQQPQHAHTSVELSDMVSAGEQDPL